MEVNGPFAHLLGLHRSLGAGRASGMPSAGSLVTVTVERYLGKGVWLLDLGGLRLEARSHLSLTPGDQFSARVARDGASLLLVSRGSGGESLSALLRNAGLPENGASRALVSLLLAGGSAAKPELLHRLSAALRRRKSGGDNARLVAESLSRGFGESSQELEELLSHLIGVGGAPGRHDEGESRRDSEEPEGEESAGAGSPGGALKDALLRTSRTGNHPLQLYNHLARRGSGWIALPLRFTASEPSEGVEKAFSGVLHILLDDAGDGGRQWTLDIRDETRRYLIGRGGDGVLELRVALLQGDSESSVEPGGAAAPDRRAVELAKLLSEAGYQIEHSEKSFDGIEFRDHSDLHEGIDLLQ